MVYCGKASQGCQNCRTRRIKCDKVRPECSQCIRVGKKCPGYRDQLSLMFRDESDKVIQKAHAQWGMGDSSDPSQASSLSRARVYYASSSSSSSASSSTSPPSLESHRPSPPTPSSPGLAYPLPSVNPVSSAIIPPPRLCAPVDPSIDEQGVQFYINRYLIGHPDEPRTSGDLTSTEWLWDPALQDVMAAIGLAGLSNLRGSQDLMTAARQRYGKALHQTRRLILTSQTPSLEVTMRAVVMLAMFELVKGTHQGIESVHAHILGGAALLRSWCSMPNASFNGIRALFQLCFTMFIPAHLVGVSPPAQFHEWIGFGSPLLDPVDRPAADLGLLIAQFVQIWAYTQSHVLSDERQWTAVTLQQMVDLDAKFTAWEHDLSGIWRYRVERTEHLPQEAVFQGEYHVYYDLWIARMWGHYRWARILLNQAVLDFVNNYPMTSLPLISAAERERRFLIIRSLAKDMLVSTPSHWRHPLLDHRSAISVEQPGGAGSGAAGIPVVLFHIKVAACAPGVPAEYWDWAQGVMECIWSDLGMLHAKSMMEAMRAHRDSLYRTQAEGILAHG